MYDYGWSVATDASGNVLVTGSFQGTVDFDPGPATQNITAVAFLDFFVIKLDPLGNLIWIKTIGGSQSEVGVSMVTNSNNDILVVGEFAGTVDFDPNAGISNLTSNSSFSDMFILHLDANGNLIWAKSVGGTGADEARSIAIDNNNSFFILGNFQGTIDLDPGVGTTTKVSGGDYDVFIQKFDANGNLVWAEAYGGSNIDQGLALDIDGSGNVYSTGYFLGGLDLDPGSGSQNHTATGGSCNIFIQKLDSNGTFVWGKVIASSTGGEQARSIVASNAGDVYVTGYVGGTVDFDPGVGVYNLVSNPSWDIFILNLNSQGNFVWAESFGSIFTDYPRSITLDVDENILLSGEFQGTVDFDFGPNTFNLIANSYDYFLLKLKPSPLTTEITQSNLEQEISLYPNPSNGIVTIDLGNIYSNTSLEIRNIYGQLVSTKNVSNTNLIHIELNEAPGIYFITLNSDNKNAVLKVVKK